MSQQACPSPTTVVYVVTGASRGIGLGLVEALAARPNTLVYATARHASKADALQQLAQQHTSLRVLQLDVQSDDEHAAVVQLVEAEAGRVDVVIANAGLNVPESFGTTDTVPLALMQQHYEVNTIAPLRLFQRLFRLLSRSDDPKFIVLSSTVGSIGSQAHAEFASMQLAVYGSSKAAVNYLVMRVHTEHTHITAFPCSPGWVETEMGDALARNLGMTRAPMAVADSVKAVMTLVEQSTRATHGGRFWSVTRNGIIEVPW